MADPGQNKDIRTGDTTVWCDGTRRCLEVDFRLYLITDRHTARKPLPKAIKEALEGGIRAVQLREKDLPIRELLSLAAEVRKITNDFGAKLFINDRADVALSVGADGIHVGHTSMPVGTIRSIVGNNMLIGASTHSKVEAVSAKKEGADFITYGPVFETPSKMKFGTPVGCESIEEVKESVDIPLFAIGGVKSGNMRRLFGAGCDGVAMISAILAADDIRAAARKVLDGIGLIEKIICHECGRR